MHYGGAFLDKMFCMKSRRLGGSEPGVYDCVMMDGGGGGGLALRLEVKISCMGGVCVSGETWDDDTEVIEVVRV